MTIDAETDPFEYGKTIAPFCWGAYWITEHCEKKYVDFWGDHCTEQLLDFLEDMPPCLIYAHNGGKFDFIFLLSALSEPFIIGSRIVKAKLGKHEIRDSFSIIPVALAAYQKDEIDYSQFVEAKREAYRNEILAYLATDCEYLYQLVFKFREQFGDQLTIASTAIKALSALHPVVKMDRYNDNIFRPYYLGGRVEYFETGKLTGDFKVYDVNSMYPHAMANYDHPFGDWLHTKDLDRALADGKVFFVEANVTSNGFGRRTKLGLDWGPFTGQMNLCSHELIPALARGEIRINQMNNILYYPEAIRFTEFVNHWSKLKIAAQENKDIAARLFAKLITNSAYGKFAQDPQKFKEYAIHLGDAIPDDCALWELYEDFETGSIWRKPSPAIHGYYNVAIGASITSASRAVLSEALSQCDRPVYCDTDSIICEQLHADLHESKLGAWKTEGKGDTLYIAGKKMYALFDSGECVKMASKGARLSGDEIAKIALGETFMYRQDAPVMKMNGSQKSLAREIKANFKEREIVRDFFV